MKRIFLGLALCAGMLFMGVTSASAYCSLDPTLGIGLPINTSLNITIGSATIYAHNNSRTTTFVDWTGLIYPSTPEVNDTPAPALTARAGGPRLPADVD